MFETGFISIDRKILEWEWYTEHNTSFLFKHLLLTVNWVDKRWRGIEVLRGQRITSLQTLAEETHLSIQNIRTAIKNLKSTGEITDISHSTYRIITVKNFDSYQDPNRRTNKQPTSSQQAPNKQPTTTKQGNNYNKETIKQESGGSSNATTPAQTMEDFVLSVETKTGGITELASKIEQAYKIPAEQVFAEFDKFVNYWCELTRDGKKKRWQLERTFEVKRRLATWFQNVQKFSGSERPKGTRIIS